MSGTNRKVYKQQLVLTKNEDIRLCPVCQKSIDWRASETRSWGETIWVDTKWGTVSVLRYIRNTYPCGCTETFDRQEDRRIAFTEASS